MIENTNSIVSNRNKKVILLVVTVLLSFFVAKVVSNPSFNAATIASLDDKKATVLKLAASSAASSTALSLLPGDVATPIANQLASLTSYFIVVLSAILLEKMLVSVVGYVSFTYIIPAACTSGILYLFFKKDVFKTIGIKLAIFGIVIFMAIPASIKVSDLIYSSQQARVEQTVEIAEKNEEYITDKKDELAKEDKNWFSKIGDYWAGLTSKIGLGVSDIVKKGENSLNNFLDATAILIITTCIIPIIVILLFVWMIKILFNFDIKLPKNVLPSNSKSISVEE